MTNLEKYASAYIDLNDIPQHIIKAASRVYERLPENSIGLVLKAYDETTNLDAKLAFELIGAALVKQANPLAMAGRALMRNKASIGINTAVLGAATVPKAFENTNELVQGAKVPVGGA